MQYKAENVDTNKALNYIEECRKEDSRNEYVEKVSVEKFHEGVRYGLDRAMGIFCCGLYEKQGTSANYYDCMCSAIEEIGNLIDIRTDDILKVARDDKGVCERFAERILAVFDRKDGTDYMRNTKEA
ncbi:MAG: hypothetical protein NC131_14835 [Roseburia sp.]|nr:hypothetical protein [Roseburia sp.]